MGGLVGNGLGGEKVFGETAGVKIEQLLDPLVTCGFEYGSGVMKLADGD